MPAKSAVLRRPSPLLAVTGLVTGVASLLWIEVLIRAWPRLMAEGVICGADQPTFIGHCAACWPAIAATVAAAGLACACVLRRGR